MIRPFDHVLKIVMTDWSLSHFFLQISLVKASTCLFTTGPVFVFPSSNGLEGTHTLIALLF
jgi:hypothetical protein